MAASRTGQRTDHPVLTGGRPDRPDGDRPPGLRCAIQPRRTNRPGGHHDQSVTAGQRPRVEATRQSRTRVTGNTPQHQNPLTGRRPGKVNLRDEASSRPPGARPAPVRRSPRRRPRPPGTPARTARARDLRGTYDHLATPGEERAARPPGARKARHLRATPHSSKATTEGSHKNTVRQPAYSGRCASGASGRWSGKADPDADSWCSRRNSRYRSYWSRLSAMSCSLV